MSTENAPLSVPDDFNKWLKQSHRYWSAPLLSLLGPLVLLLVNYGDYFKGVPLSFALLLFQVIAITILLVVIPEPGSNVKVSRQASTAVEQFHEGWKWLWFFWLLLYLGLTGKEYWKIHLETVTYKGDPTGLAGFTKSWEWTLGSNAENLLNNLPTLALVMCYLVVSRKTVPDSRGKAPLPWLKGIGLLATLTLAELLLTFADPPLLETPRIQAPELFRWLSGLGAGVVTALLIGRLDSRAIGLPVWVVALTYIYAVIQPGWAAFPNQPHKNLLVVAALFLKTLMFLLVAWLLKSGVLLFYMTRLRAEDENIKKQRATFVRGLQPPKLKSNRALSAKDAPGGDKIGAESGSPAHENRQTQDSVSRHSKRPRKRNPPQAREQDDMPDTSQT